MSASEVATRTDHDQRLGLPVGAGEHRAQPPDQRLVGVDGVVDGRLHGAVAGVDDQRDHRLGLDDAYRGGVVADDLGDAPRQRFGGLRHPDRHDVVETAIPTTTATAARPRRRRRRSRSRRWSAAGGPGWRRSPRCAAPRRRPAPRSQRTRAPAGRISNASRSMVAPSASCPSTRTRPTADGVTDKPSTASTYHPFGRPRIRGDLTRVRVAQLTGRCWTATGGSTRRRRNVLCDKNLVQVTGLHLCRRIRIRPDRAPAIPPRGRVAHMAATGQIEGAARRTHAVRPSDRADQPVRRRTVGALLVLRDAHDPRLLPLLLGHRRRPRAAEEPPRPASSAPTAGWSTCRPCSAAGSPTGCSAWSAPCFYGGVVVMLRPHRAGGPARPGRRRRRPGAGRAGLGRAEGQRVVAARHALREGRPALPTAGSRCSIWASTSARSSAR